MKFWLHAIRHDGSSRFSILMFGTAWAPKIVIIIGWRTMKVAAEKSIAGRPFFCSWSGGERLVSGSVSFHPIEAAAQAALYDNSACSFLTDEWTKPLPGTISPPLPARPCQDWKLFKNNTRASNKFKMSLQHGSQYLSQLPNLRNPHVSSGNYCDSVHWKMINCNEQALDPFIGRLPLCVT